MTAPKKIVITAGGTGGHIFPALSVAQVFARRYTNVSLLWIGTYRSREVELCKKNNIPIMILDVIGITRRLSITAVISAVIAVVTFVRAVVSVMCQFRRDRPNAVIAFGGYVCAPVLAAAVLKKIPIYLQEQNTVAGLVNRLFLRYCRKMFLGFPLVGNAPITAATEVTGTPVRTGVTSYDHFPYPTGLDRTKKTVLISGGSQGAKSMNDCLVEVVGKWAAEGGLQVIWQTGVPSYENTSSKFKERKTVLVFATIDDLYPYYAVSKLVICRAGASTLAEVSFFGLPCVMIPLPWAAENHQWMNAGLVESQGWGIRVAQDGQCGQNIEKAVGAILSDEKKQNAMSMKALDNSPAEAAEKIAAGVAKDLGL
jgi:UDP-N-acetylglucosamine--N-acetylmuramyl-(pentapeptide) pyrophosphoryl-undecaprenol N-acetylglucosamine transferase